MMRVLIVDDNEELTTLKKEMLEKEGMTHVETAENGDAGYLAFLRFKPDIITTDIDMPVKKVMQSVKEKRVHNPGIKAIYMSGEMNSYRVLLQKKEPEYKANLLPKPSSLPKMISHVP